MRLAECFILDQNLIFYLLYKIISLVPLVLCKKNPFDENLFFLKKLLVGPQNEADLVNLIDALLPEFFVAIDLVVYRTKEIKIFFLIFSFMKPFFILINLKVFSFLKEHH